MAVYPAMLMLPQYSFPHLIHSPQIFILVVVEEVLKFGVKSLQMLLNEDAFAFSRQGFLRRLVEIDGDATCLFE